MLSCGKQPLCIRRSISSILSVWTWSIDTRYFATPGIMSIILAMSSCSLTSSFPSLFVFTKFWKFELVWVSLLCCSSCLGSSLFVGGQLNFSFFVSWQKNGMWPKFNFSRISNVVLCMIKRAVWNYSFIPLISYCIPHFTRDVIPYPFWD